MNSTLLPALVLSFFISILAVQYNSAKDVLPSATLTQATIAGQIFISYSNAVAVYLKNHPTFNGTVSGADLAAQGTVFSPEFLALAGNAITPTGVSGHVITCYASLPTGAINAVRTATESDASYGLASGTYWTSIAAGAATRPLTTTVPDGAVVSVIQVGA